MQLTSWLQSGKKSADRVENDSCAKTEELESETSIGANWSTVSAGSVGQTPSASASTTKWYKSIRKYDPNYIKFGFIWSGREEEPGPQCVVCGEVLSNDCMKPSHLNRHLMTKHKLLPDKPVDFFL